MTREQFNPEHHIQDIASSFSVSADYKITTNSDNQKVKYDKTIPIAQSGEGPWTISDPESGSNLKKMLKYSKTNPISTHQMGGNSKKRC